MLCCRLRYIWNCGNLFWHRFCILQCNHRLWPIPGHSAPLQQVGNEHHKSNLHLGRHLPLHYTVCDSPCLRNMESVRPGRIPHKLLSRFLHARFQRQIVHRGHLVFRMVNPCNSHYFLLCTDFSRCQRSRRENQRTGEYFFPHLTGKYSRRVSHTQSAWSFCFTTNIS